MNNLFETKKKELFLVFKNSEDNTINFGCEQLHDSKPIEFDDLFTEVDLSHMQASTEFYKIHCAMIIGNRIAAQTRRGFANMLFVPDQETKVWFESATIETSREMFSNIIVCDSLQKNEIRCAYWKNIQNSIVDGGIQYHPDGFSCQSNYKDYFTKCFIN